MGGRIVHQKSHQWFEQVSNREAESTDALERGGLPRSSNEAGVMPVERRGRVIAVELGPTGLPGGAQGSAEGGSLRAMARAG